MKQLLLITALITSFASFSYAKSKRRVVTNGAFNIQPKDGGASFLVVTGQVLDLESCKEEACIVKYKGETFSLPRLALRTVHTRRTAPAAKASYEGTINSRRGEFDTELGTGATRPAIDKVSRRNSSSSSFNSCYSRHKRTYTSKKYCKNSQGVRFVCGTKSPYSSGGLCYKGVKNILLRCGATDRYISGAEAKKAGDPLLAQGFKKLSTKDPRKAPPGSVVVYANGCSATHPAGHIEVKISETQWVSDFIGTQPLVEKMPTCRPVKAIYFK